MSKRYRKLPVIVEAMQWVGLNPQELKDFCGKDVRIDTMLRTLDGFPDIAIWNSLEKDWINCPLNHYVIKGIRGEFYPHDPEVFAEVYEEVT